MHVNSVGHSRDEKILQLYTILVVLWEGIYGPVHTGTNLRYRTVPLRSVPKSGTERGCVHTGTEKIKRSVPKQVQKLGGTEK